MRIAFDVGGVLSKYPHTLKPLLALIHQHGFTSNVEAWIISDMHPEQKIIDMLQLNEVHFLMHRVRSADYATHGENCKAVLCKELGIDILIDDFPGYVASGEHMRLMVMPAPTEPYFHDDWKTDGSEGSFGRRVRPASSGGD